MAGGALRLFILKRNSFMAFCFITVHAVAAAPVKKQSTKVTGT